LDQDPATTGKVMAARELNELATYYEEALAMAMGADQAAA
jgi:hypothetical protein